MHLLITALVLASGGQWPQGSLYVKSQARLGAKLLSVCPARTCPATPADWLGAGLSFVRTSAWTCQNDDGSIQTLTSGSICAPKATNTASNGYGWKIRGLGPSAGVTNLCQRDAAVGTSPWALDANTTAPASATNSPDQTADANDITEGSTASATYTTHQAITILASTQYTWSVYAVPSATNTFLGLQCTTGATARAIFFNMTTGATSGGVGGGTGVFTAAPGSAANGFNRYALTFTSGVGETAATCYVAPTTSSTSMTHAGSVGAKTTAYGAQLEAGATASDLCATAGSTAVCGPESLVTASAVAMGTTPSFGADFIGPTINGTVDYVIGPANTGTDRWDLDLNRTPGKATCGWYNGSTFFNTLSTNSFTAGAWNHASCSFDGTNMVTILNGVRTSSAQAITASSAQIVGIGNERSTLGNQLTSTVSSVCVDPSPWKCQ